MQVEPRIVAAPPVRIPPIDLIVTPSDAPFTASMTSPVYLDNRSFGSTLSLKARAPGVKVKLLIASGDQVDGWESTIVDTGGSCFGATGRVDHLIPASDKGSWRSDGRGFLELPAGALIPTGISFYCREYIRPEITVSAHMRIYYLNDAGGLSPADVAMPEPVGLINRN